MRVLVPRLAIALCLLVACDDASKAKDAATKAAQTAADKTQEVVDDASKRVDDLSKKASDAAGKTANDALDSAKAAGSKAWAAMPDSGELSSSAMTWMKETAESTDMRAIVAKGVQIAPVALEIGKTINAAVDGDTAIEPIYQSLDGRDPAEVDKAIGNMPRVEVVDGVKVGFSQLNKMDAGTSIDERAYLMTWRRDDHIIGMVYRTKRTIDIEMLVKEAPRLIALTQAAIAAQN
jgi:hypothetical protein